MISKFKAAALICLLLAVLGLTAGCAPDKTPYEVNDGENYTVSVKFDANGGFFTTNTSVIVDSYNPNEVGKNAAGQPQIALLSPDNALRGNDAFTPVNNGYFLAGWYSQRTETLGADGQPEVVYSGRWDFEKDLLTLDPGKTYSASEPVLTLYAAWIPMFQIEFYDLASGEYMNNYVFDPTLAEAISVPAWDRETGTIEMYDFPQRAGYTFRGAYYDAEGKKPVATEAVEHPGVVDLENGVAKNGVLKLYVDWMEGEWYRIYNAEQFLDNASVNGCYEIHADLDFEGLIWPSSLMYGNFAGSIQGNGHVLRNISMDQTNNSKVNAGLFGHLTEDAELTDVTFENVTFTLRSGTRVTGASFGLLTGAVSEGADISGVQILNSVLQIDSGCYFGTDDYVIGLVCGMGDAGVSADGITCKAVGEDPDSVKIRVENGVVTLEFAQ